MPQIDITAYVEQIVKPGYSGHPLKRARNKNETGWLEIRERMGVHLLGEFPENLLRAKRPNDKEVWHRWKQNNFTPITKGPANRAAINERRTLAESNYTVTFAPNDEDTPTYVTGRNFEGKDLANWLWSHAHLLSKYDPNAVIVAMPYAEGGELGNSDRVDVKLCIIDSVQLIDVRDDLISWKDYEKNYYNEGGVVQEGDIFWIIDGENYYKITQIGSTKREFEFEVYYSHQSGKPLFAHLPAFEEKRQNKVIRRSFYEPYAAWADDQLLAYADLKISEALHVHPVSVEKPRDCDYVSHQDGVECAGGTLTYINGGQLVTDRVCPSCKGKGIKPAIQPGEAIVRDLPTSEMDPAYHAKDIPEIEYVERPIDQLKFAKDLVEWRADKAKEAINLKRIDTNQSGIAKVEDRHDEESMIQLVGRMWFRCLEDVLGMVVKLRNRNNWQQILPSVTPATDYNLKTETDLLERLKMVKDSGAPVSVYLAAVNEYVNRAYANNRITKLKIEIALFADYLQVHDLEYQNLALANGSAELRDLVLSLRVSQWIDEVLETQPTSIEWSPVRWMTEIQKRVDAEMAEREPEQVENPLSLNANQ